MPPYSLDLLERDDEIAILGAVLDSARGGSGGLVLIEGAAGIGKTELLRQATQRAADVGMRVLRAAGTELEHECPWGVARMLLEGALRGLDPTLREELLMGAAQPARALLEEPAAAPQPFVAVAHALYWVLAGLAERSSLLVALDDLHVADEPSLAMLRYVARRVDELPVAVVAARRLPDPSDDLAALAVERLHPTPLSPRAVEQLLQEALGADSAVRLTGACLDSTGGNPFLLHELVTALSQRPVEPESLHAVIAGDAATRIRARVAGSHASAVAVARAVAALGTDAELRRVAALAELSLAEVESVTDRLTAAGVLRDARPPEFVHPLVEAAVHDELGSGTRAALHGRAARLLDQEGFPAERVAGHLLRAEPAEDERAVAVLRRAAALARRRGAPRAATALLERALREPPPPALRDAVALELGVALVDVDPAAAQRVLDELKEVATANIVRAQAGLALGRVVAMTGDLPAAIAVLDRALDDLDGEDPDAAAEIECDLLSLARFTPAERDRLRDRTARFLERNDTPDTPNGRRLRNELLREAAMGGTAERETALALEALGDGQMLRERGPGDQTYFHFVGNLAYAGQITLALRAIDDAIAAAERCGSTLGHAQAAAARLGVLWEAGALEEIISAGPDVVMRLEEVQWGLWVPFAAAFLLAAHAERGEREEVEALIGRPAVEAAVHEHPAAHFVLWARGRARARQGRLDEAVADLEASDRIQKALSVRHPRGTTVVPELSIALWQIGRAEEAVHLAREHVELCRRYAAAPALGDALRACGTVQDGPGGILLLEEAVAVLRGSGAALDEALAALALGARRRRDRGSLEAREPLRHAMAVAERCGATGIAARARAELQAAGGRPRTDVLTGPAALTPSERRVSQLAASGMTNRQIAQTIFVTLKTVEKHLAGSYRKLGVRTRGELAEALRPPGDP